MQRSFIDPDFHPTETSAQLSFGGNRLDRLSEERADDCVETALADDAARLFGVAKGRVLLDFSGSTPRGVMTKQEIDQHQPWWDRAILLGYDKGSPRLAVPLKLDPDGQDFALPDHLKLVDFRSLAMQELLDHEVLGQVAQGAATLAWHSSARFCGRCGGSMEMRGGGVKRVCMSCERELFPRTDPVVIMLTLDGERCLLGRSHHFPPGMYSALAGFVEPGESLEMAVRRETFEESGLRVGAVQYHASQPWPFAHSLMIGCYGQALETDIDHDAQELDDCRWFERAQILDLMAKTTNPSDGADQLFIPPKSAIASRLITDWAKGNAGLRF